MIFLFRSDRMHWRCFSLHNFTVVTEFIYASSQILVAETDRSPNFMVPRSTHLTWGPIVSAAHPGQWAQRRRRNGVHRTNFRQIEELHKPSWHICTFTWSSMVIMLKTCHECSFIVDNCTIVSHISELIPNTWAVLFSDALSVQVVTK